MRRAASGRSWLGVPWWTWVLGLALALLVMGPALAPGSLLNLDLVMVPHPPIPRGTWGLGPELPRRVPMWIPIAWLSALFGGDTVGKAVMVGCLVFAFVGMVRLVGRRNMVAAVAAGLLYAFGPFTLTRLAVGHLMVVWTMAVLPWSLDDLFEPGRSVKRTTVWCTLLGFTGIYGGAIAAIMVGIGLAVSRGRRLVPVAIAGLVTQLPWLVPLAVVGAGQTHLADASNFPTAASGMSGVGQLFVGYGFWNSLQVGGRPGVGVAVAGFVLVGLAAVGSVLLPERLRLPMALLAAIGFVMSVASGVAGLQGPFSRFTATALGAPFRESQRMLPLFLVWLAPGAALGVVRIGRHLRRSGRWLGAAPALALAALVLVLVWPGFWDVKKELIPTHFPVEWQEARSVVRSQPGTVVALPWTMYTSTGFPDADTPVLNLPPLYLGGDVMVSSDPATSAQVAQERADPREHEVTGVVYGALSTPASDGGAGSPGRFVADDLAALGVRWVALAHVSSFAQYTGVTADPGLELVVDGPTLSLYRVRPWVGSIVGADGRVVPASSVVAPFNLVDASGDAVWASPYQPGWLRGTTPAGEAPHGLIALPAGSGPVWYWPALVVLIGDLLALAAFVWGLDLHIRHRIPRFGFRVRYPRPRSPLPQGADSEAR